MTSSAHNGTIERVIEALREVGPMTATQMARYLDISRDSAAALLGCLRTQSPRHLTKRAYVCDWSMGDDSDTKRYPRPVYALGDKPDKKKPPPLTSATKSKNYRAKLVKTKQAVSVFAQGAKGYRSAAQARRRRELDAANPNEVGRSHKRMEQEPPSA